jgi:hypothetical protein
LGPRARVLIGTEIEGRRRDVQVSIECAPICRTVGQGVPGARLDRRRKCARPCAACQPGPRQIVWAFCAQLWSSCQCKLDHSPCPARQRRRLPSKTENRKCSKPTHGYLQTCHSTELLGEHRARRGVPVSAARCCGMPDTAEREAHLTRPVLCRSADCAQPLRRVRSFSLRVTWPRPYPSSALSRSQEP